MEKASRWVLIGVLGYIGVVLTMINDKMGQIDLQTTEYAVLNEVKPQSFRGEETPASVRSVPAAASSFQVSPLLAAFSIAGLIGIFMTWHLSRLYHDQKWSKQIMHKSYNHHREPIVELSPRERLHPDQEGVTDAPHVDGRIKDSWLPPQAQRLYSGWGGKDS